MKTIAQRITNNVAILLVSITLCSLGLFRECGTQHQQVHEGRVQSSMKEKCLLKADGTVDKHLLAFLDLYELKHDGTAASVNQVMQKNFLRPSGKERRDLVDSELDKKLRDKALKLLTNMGLVARVPHTTISVDYFFLFGAMIGAVERRFDDFLAQYNQKTLRCSNLVFLGGVRKLRQHEIEDIETKLGAQGLQAFLKQINKTDKKELTEADLLRFIWMQYAPDTMKVEFKENDNLFFINSTKTTDGTNKRPITVNTLEAWYETCGPINRKKFAKCHFHANVEQPYALRFEKTLRLFLEKTAQELASDRPLFYITWNSPQASQNLPISIYKDALAREFYTELTLKNFLKTN